MLESALAGSAGSQRVLMVANRLPVTAYKEGGTIRYLPSVGGLATGLRQVAKRWPTLWFGWAGLARDPDKTELSTWAGDSLVGIGLSEAEITHFYRRYCNSLLWPVLHGWSDESPPSGADWETYQAVNSRYAAALLERARSDDFIWIHDYHLLLLPGMLRPQLPHAPIAFFLHTPFPEPAVFASIPQRAELVSGMLGADVIGFHTERYAHNFLRAARALGYRTRHADVLVGNRRATVRTRPMGIDVDSFARLGTDPAVLLEVENIRTSKSKLMLGVDRLDYTKGIPQRLLAFEYLLQQHPELCGRVSFIQVAVPSRQELEAYADLRNVVEGTVARINARFGTAGWTPVDYLYGTVDLNTLASLYRAADVMVVTAQSDGLNLVAKEFVATRADGDGVLILSKFAGAAAELTAALLVDPGRVAEVAEAYRSALLMPIAKRRKRMRALRRVIEANNVYHWAADFLERLPA